MATGLAMEFVRKPALLQQRGKPANRGKKRFLLAGRNEEVGRLFRMGGLA